MDRYENHRLISLRNFQSKRKFVILLHIRACYSCIMYNIYSDPLVKIQEKGKITFPLYLIYEKNFSERLVWSFITDLEHRHLVLKTHFYMYDLEAVLEVFPDACVVMPRRKLTAVVGSSLLLFKVVSHHWRYDIKTLCVVMAGCKWNPPFTRFVTTTTTPPPPAPQSHRPPRLQFFIPCSQWHTHGSKHCVIPTAFLMLAEHLFLLYM